MIGLTPGEILLDVGIGAAVESLTFAISWGLVRELILANLILGFVAAFMVILGTILIIVLIR
jgi:multisubunit Na+/H+ antiporter MnhE subunit